MRSNVKNPATGEWERSGDNWRTERQKNVVWSLIRQLRNLDMDKITKLVKEVMPMVATDLSYNDFIVKMAGYLDYKRYSVSTFSIPAPHTWIYGEGSYVEIFDWDANRKGWKEFVYL
jgi:anionic cell wall polymer biosynthesis LytR-Cps2A-Psr (LCP) family protein